ncbi:hypothetical protein C8R45DRAFT_945244 [Mycena sanguinolenta]|nr:hypothetical protein C8R45DRAFT_945244 [Mycena sanguinolenta]
MQETHAEPLHNPLNFDSALAALSRVDDFEDLLTDDTLQTNHTKEQRPSEAVKQRIRELVEHCDIPDSYEDFQPTIAPRAVASLVPVVDNMYGCPHCPVTGGLKYVRTHLEKNPHPAEPKLPPIEGLRAQVVNKMNFRVAARTACLPESVVPSLGDQMSGFDWRQEPGLATTNARLISPFLNRTKWHEIREPYSDHLPELIALAAFPSDDDSPKLVPLVREYFRYADSLFEHTEELVLQRLNTHNPDKSGINNTPFHRHHMGDETAQQYVNITVRLVASLLRHSEVFSMEPSDALATDVEALRTALSSDTPPDSQELLHRVLGSLWRSRWRQTTTSRMPDPTMRFLMLLSSQSSGEFAAAKDTSGPIRKLCWGIQMHALVEIHRIVDTEGIFQIDAFERVAEYVVEKDVTTYATLWSLQHYVTTLSMQTLSMPKIWWLDRETWSEMLYKGNKISLSQIQEVFTALEADIVRLWEDDVLVGLNLHVQWSTIADDLTEKRAGYSFLEDVRNPFHTHTNAFASALDDNLDARKKFTAEASGFTRLDLLKARDWLYKLAKLEGLLMLLIDMLGGAPPRGTELVSMLACNTTLRLRNLAALGRFVAIIRQYDKTSNVTQSDRLIPHSISAVAADILIQLHTFARPWARFLASKVWNTDPAVCRAYGEMLFMDFGQMFTSDRLTALMRARTSRVLGWELSISPWRHINIAWRRKLCGGAAELFEQEVMSTINAMQSGHSSTTENMVYGLSPDSLMGAPEDVLNLFLLTSGEWQKVARMVPGGLGLDYRTARCTLFESLVAAGVIALKGGRPVVAVTHDTVKSADVTEQLAQQLAKVSLGGAAIMDKQDQALAILSRLEARIAELELLQRRNTHASPPPLIDHPPAITDFVFHQHSPPSRPAYPRTPGKKRQASAASPSGWSFFYNDTQHLIELQTGRPIPIRSSQRSRNRPDPEPVEQNVLDTVRKVLNNPSAGWKDVTQYEAIRECLALQRDVVVTSKTGSGKSLIAVVPSLLEDAITVIVVPLLSLMEDWERRLDAFGIPYERFRGAANPKILGQANIVLVTSDMLKGKAWTAAIAELSQRRTITRIVVDEGHYYAADRDFRHHALAQPYHIRGWNFQVVLLSATVPDGAFRFLVHEFELERPLRITSGAHRPELNVIIDREARDSAQQLERVKAILDKHVRRDDWRAEARWIIFVSSLADGERYASMLGVPFYKAAKGPSKQEDDGLRQQIYRDWLAGVIVGLVATSALGAGNDYAHVRLTLHINCPFDLSSFYQQAGRAGRDGQRAYNYIVARAKVWASTKQPHPTFGDLVGGKAMSDLVYHQPASFPEKCLTFQITRFFDGTGHTCAEFLRQNSCAACKGRPLPHEPPLGLPLFQADKPLLYTEDGADSKKRKLEEGFADATHRAVKRTGQDLSGIQDGFDLYRRIFALVGQACGVCFCFGQPEPGVHPVSECPQLQSTPNLLTAFRELKATVRYPPGVNGPCYTCHIVSGGRNALHPAFAKGRSGALCTHPTLALSIAFGIYVERAWRKRALKYFAPEREAPPYSWDSVAGFARWYTTRDKQGVWRSMAMIRFFGEHMFS